MRRVWSYFRIFVVVGIFACSSKEEGNSPKSSQHSEAEIERTNVEDEGKIVSQTVHDLGTAEEEVGLPPGPFTIARTALDSRLSQTREGQELQWNSLGEIEVLSEEFREVYKSREKTYLSFKARILAKKNCLVDWRVEFIAGKTGRGKSLAQVSGLVPVREGRQIDLSGVVAVSDESAPEVASASAGYWTLCGAKMPSPNVHSLKIESAVARELKFGAVPDIHHTEVVFSGKAPNKKRCYVELVVEDVDSQGFTLNRDFASFGIGSKGNDHSALLRRTSFASGAERDYDKLAVKKRSYLRDLYCTGPADTPAESKMLQITKLSLHAHKGEAMSAEHLARQSYGHSMALYNTIGAACAFRLRYRIVDKEGIAINRASALSEAIHLRKGAKVNYHSKSDRLFVWLDLAKDVDRLIVESIRPIDDCKAFDPTKAVE